jgi:glucosyl-3-phosphoglycerate phosphatase
MMRLLLVRHGQSEWNAGRVLQGQADIPLSDLGRAQAQALASVIARMQPDRAITSDLLRARETAALIGYPQARLEPALREIHVGAWEGQSIPDLIAADADAYAGWRAGTHRPDGGEVWDEFTARASAAIRAEMAKGGAQTLLAVCHGGVIRALLQRFLNLAPRQIIPAAPASVTALRMDAGGGHARLEVFNYRPGEMDLDPPD